ncbi:MAG: asparagine synthase-related protein [Magnetospirillum sp.]|nr:asparagine synthase-related protein [Magnetospirillum sp.]
MSAIAGLVSLDSGAIEVEPAEGMAAAMTWRGGDEDGSYRSPDGRAALAARRRPAAAAGAAQPLTNETHDIWLVLDGEILNHRALRHSLELVGHRFRTSTDAEVALHAYEQWGLEFPGHLQGAFALALWDDRRDRLVLARDHMGRKPLFAARYRGRVAFASEIEPLLRELGLPRRLDPAALGHYLALGTVPAPATLVAGITKLGAGEMLVVDRRVAPRRLRWRALPPDGGRAATIRGLPVERHAGNLRTLLECAVADRLTGSGPVGVWLTPSAGSGAIAAICTRLTGSPPSAVAVVDSVDSAAAEAIRHLAGNAGVQPTELAVDAGRLAAALPAMVARLSEPVAAPALAAGWFAAAALGEGRSQALLADTGAEELLLTHPAYEGARHGRWHRLLQRLRPRRSAGRSLPPALRPFQGDAAQVLVAALPLAEIPFPPVPLWMGEDDLAVLGLDDLALRIADGVAPGVDAMAQAHGLEARLPFLDDALVDFALAIPGRIRSPAAAPRQLLRRMLGDLAPAGALARGRPPLPLAAWLAGPLGETVGEVAGRWPLLDPRGVAALLATHRAQPGYGQSLWALLVLAQWCATLGLDQLAEAGEREEMAQTETGKA